MSGSVSSTESLNMDVRTLVQRLSAEIGSPGLALNEQGLARLRFDGRWAIDLEWDESRKVLHLYALAGQLPIEGREAFMIRLLAANSLGLATAGASFALDPETGEVLLCARIDPETVSFDSFKAVLENMLETLDQQVTELFKLAPEGSLAARVMSVESLRVINSRV